jgi:hypothetical protein
MDDDEDDDNDKDDDDDEHTHRRAPLTKWPSLCRRGSACITKALAQAYTPPITNKPLSLSLRLVSISLAVGPAFARPLPARAA